MAQINRDIERIVPWLIAPGAEQAAKSSNPIVEIRARKIADGWIVIATNTEPKACDVIISAGELGDVDLRSPYVNHVTTSKSGQWPEHFAGYEEKVYLTGPEPRWR